MNILEDRMFTAIDIHIRANYPISPDKQYSRDVDDFKYMIEKNKSKHDEQFSFNIDSMNDGFVGTITNDHYVGAELELIALIPCGKFWSNQEHWKFFSEIEKIAYFVLEQYRNEKYPSQSFLPTEPKKKKIDLTKNPA